MRMMFDKYIHLYPIKYLSNSYRNNQDYNRFSFFTKLFLLKY
jgi:hypothetical protein